MVMADIQPVFVQTEGKNVMAMRYAFYMPNGASIAEVLARLTTYAGASVLEWPKFRPTAHTLTLKGQEISLSAGLDASQVSSYSAATTSFQMEVNKELSFSGSLSVKTVTLPPCIHGTITIANPTLTKSISSTVSLSIPGTTGSGGIPSYAAYNRSATSPVYDVVASVTPTTLAATSGGAIPTSGLYLYDLNSTPDAWEHNRVIAIVVNFAHV
jgi:hypothetical protein